MDRTIVVMSFTLMYFSQSVFAGISLNDEKSVQLVLDGRNIVHDIELIKNAENVIEIEEGKMFAYKSNFRDDMGVIVHENVDGDLVIMIFPEEGAVNVTMEALVDAMLVELSFLTHAGVIKGLGEEDISSIANELGIDRQGIEERAVSKSAYEYDTYATQDYPQPLAVMDGHETAGAAGESMIAPTSPSEDWLYSAIDLPEEDIIITKIRIINDNNVQNPFVHLILILGVCGASYALILVMKRM